MKVRRAAPACLASTPARARSRAELDSTGGSASRSGVSSGGPAASASARRAHRRRPAAAPGAVACGRALGAAISRSTKAGPSWACAASWSRRSRSARRRGGNQASTAPTWPLFSACSSAHRLSPPGDASRARVDDQAAVRHRSRDRPAPRPTARPADRTASPAGRRAGSPQAGAEQADLAYARMRQQQFAEHATRPATARQLRRRARRSRSAGRARRCRPS